MSLIIIIKRTLSEKLSQLFTFNQSSIFACTKYTKRQKVLFPLSQTYTSSGMKVFVLFHFIQD